MDQFRIAADSSCNLLALDGADFVSVPLTIRTDAEDFRDDASLDVDAMVAALRATKGRSYSACPNIADWEKAFGERGDVIAFIPLQAPFRAATMPPAWQRRTAKSTIPPAVSTSSIRCLPGRKSPFLLKKRCPSCTPVQTLTMRAEPYRRIKAERTCSLRWNPCTTLPRTGESASSQLQWRASSESAPSDRPVLKGRLRRSENAGDFRRRGSLCCAKWKGLATRVEAFGSVIARTRRLPWSFVTRFSCVFQRRT